MLLLTTLFRLALSAAALLLSVMVLRLPVDVNIEPGIATLTRFWWP